MSKKCLFKFYSQSDKACVYSPSIGSEFCLFHDATVAKEGDFVRVRLKSAIAETGGDLEGFLLRKADLSGMNLRDVDLRDADLRETKLDGADFRNADFRGAKMNRASALNAIFEGANFMAANLNDGNYTGANFKNCNLRIVNLGHAVIKDADFSGSDLRNTDFSKTEQSPATNFTNVVGITAKIERGDDSPLLPDEPVPEAPPAAPATGAVPRPVTGAVVRPAVMPPPTGATPRPPGMPGTGGFPLPPGVVPGSTVFPRPLGAPVTGPVIRPSMGQPPTTPMSPGALPPGTGVHTGATGAAAADDAGAGSFFESFDPSQAGSDALAPGAPLTKREDRPTEDDGPLAGAAPEAAARDSEDETDYGLAAQPESPLTMRHHSGRTAGRLGMYALAAAAALAASIALERFAGVSARMGLKPAAAATTGQDLAPRMRQLEAELQTRTAELTDVQARAAALAKDLTDARAQVETVNAMLLDLKKSGADGKAVARLTEEKVQAEKRVRESEEKYAALVTESRKKEDQLLQMAVQNTELREKSNEIKQANKNLMTEKADLEQRLKEGTELQAAFKSRLEGTEAARLALEQKLAESQDPLIREHPGWQRMIWSTYAVLAPSFESYILGLKFTVNNDGTFITADLMMVGKLPITKPAFRILFFDAAGKQLQKVLKYADEAGIRFQQVRLGNHSWKHTEAAPVYFQVEFQEKQ
ncbi:MAG: pentapeptide repeat-containing protein [Planctomycetota bacterium]